MVWDLNGTVMGFGPEVKQESGIKETGSLWFPVVIVTGFGGSWVRDWD